uniref:protein-tyrosine-phosphatase n=1 Tax=Romanomermis culicivorax TaxID=13658 RepID=A0A915L646_ROMCU
MKREDESEQQGGPPKRRPDRPKVVFTCCRERYLIKKGLMENENSGEATTSSFLDFQVACSPLFPSSSIADLESASSSAVAVNKFFDLPSSPVQMLGVSTALGGAAAEVFSKNNEQEQQQQKTLPPFQHYRKSTNHHHHHHGNKNAVDMLSMSTITVPPTDKDLVAGGGGNLNVSNRALTSLSQPCLPVCVQGPTKILPFVYLGSQQDVLDEETLKKYGIEFVLNLSTTCPKPDHLQEEHFLRIPVQDSYSEELLPYFEEAFEFLDKVREASGVALIHCLAGISRSPTLAIAYVMRYLHMSQDEAYRYVKEKRPSISPNFNFLGQLLEYEQYLLNTNRKEFEKFPTGHSAIKSAQISPVINNRDQNQPIPQISKSRTMMTLPFAKNNDDTIPEYYGKRRLLDQNFLPENLRRNFYQQEILCGNANFMKNSVLSDNQDLPSPSTELSKLNFGGNANTSHVTISCNNRDSNINRVIKPPSLNLRLKSNFDDQKATSSKMNPMFDDGPNDQNSILKNDIPMDIQENSKFDEQKTNFYSNPKILFPAVDQQ